MHIHGVLFVFFFVMWAQVFCKVSNSWAQRIFLSQPLGLQGQCHHAKLSDFLPFVCVGAGGPAQSFVPSTHSAPELYSHCHNVLLKVFIYKNSMHCSFCNFFFNQSYLKEYSPESFVSSVVCDAILAGGTSTVCRPCYHKPWGARFPVGLCVRLSQGRYLGHSTVGPLCVSPGPCSTRVVPLSHTAPSSLLEQPPSPAACHQQANGDPPHPTTKHSTCS